MMNRYFEDVADQPDYLQRQALVQMTGLEDTQIQVSKSHAKYI